MKETFPIHIINSELLTSKSIMKIGVITFHWATNYGAVLQAYALQEALSSLGHQVEIINYKPKQFDKSLWKSIRQGKILKFKSFINNRYKEKKLISFRHDRLILTKRYYTIRQLCKAADDYDVLVTGSDQILNPFFLEHGEEDGSTAYFLDFGGKEIRRYAYAASFGVTQYPVELIDKVTPLIGNFRATSARENSGIDIFKLMGADAPLVVCDPTLLHKSEFYDQLVESPPSQSFRISAYFLRGRDKVISYVLSELEATRIRDESLPEWLNSIKTASHFVTNSYHGVIFSLLFHTPFSVVLSTKENIGMNDRFYTLLSKLNLQDRIFSEADFQANDIEFSENWDTIDTKLEEFRKTGWKFIKSI